MKKTIKFIVKFRGKHYKALYISRTKNCIVLKCPGVPFHRTFPVNDKNFHFTIEGLFPDAIINKNSPFKHTLKKGILHVFYPIRKKDLADGVGLGSSGLEEECTEIGKSSEVIDLDELGCVAPDFHVDMFSHDKEVEVPDAPFIVSTKNIEYRDAKIVIYIVDNVKKGKYIKEIQKKEKKIKGLEREKERLKKSIEKAKYQIYIKCKSRVVK